MSLAAFTRWLAVENANFFLLLIPLNFPQFFVLRDREKIEKNSAPNSGDVDVGRKKIQKEKIPGLNPTNIKIQKILGFLTRKCYWL